MADYFDFIKKTVSNATANPPLDKSQDPNSKIQTNANDQAPNNQAVSPVVPPVAPAVPPVAAPLTSSPAAAVNTQPPVQNPVKPEDKKVPGQETKPPVTGTPQGKPADQTKNNLDLMTHLTQRSNRVMMTAQTKAKELKSDIVDSEHLLYALTTDSEIYNLLVETKIQPQLVTDELNKVFKRGTVDKPIQFSPRIKKILNDALVVARKLGFEFIAPEHLLLSLFEEGEGVGARVLVKLGLNKEELNKKIVGRKEGLTEDEKKAQNKKKALEQVTIDLTAKASQGLLDPVVERSAVIERVIHILSRRSKNNPSLVGEAGVGKTAIVEGLAEKIVAKEVPEPLLNKRILQLDLMSMLAGASHRGEFEERMKDLIEEVKASQGQIILFIDEIHNIVGAGSSGEGSLDASNFLKPALARGEIQIVGATTLTEYRKYVEKDPALERRFQPVLVPEPTEEQGIKMLKSIKDKYEAFHRVKIPDDAIEAAVVLSKRYVGDRFLPDKAVDLIDEAAAAVRLPLISLPEEIKSLETRIAQLNQELKESEKKADKVKSRILRSKIDEINSGLKEKKDEFNLKKGQSTGAVSVEIIKDIIARWTGIPVAKISSSETEKLAHLEDILHKRLIGQEGAVASVSQAVRRGRAGLKSAVRPIGSFIFLGPTGVGKTELAKSLADILFGSEDLMIRFDMTEYMEKHEVSKLLGAPPGYVGYEEGGKLTEAVRRKPYSVVLFDEVEKAHPDIFNILLQILDDGRLTDNKGHVVSFKNTVVICTSNLGTKLIQDELLKGAKASAKTSDVKQKTKVEDDKDKTKFKGIKEKVMVELTKFFKPELINRFDEVIVFEPLRFQDMIQIVKLQMKGVVKMIEEQDMGFAYTDEVVQAIVKEGFDPIYGARPLRRAIQKLIENPISNLIIDGKAKAGDLIRTRVDRDELIFEIEKTVFQPRVTKNYHCQGCGWDFENEIVQNATIICPKCLKHGDKVSVVEKPKAEELKIPEPVVKAPDKATDVKPQDAPDKKTI